MSKKNQKKSKPQDIDINKSLKQIETLSTEAIAKLKTLCDEMLDIAKNVKEDYDLDTSTLNDMSGSITQIHESSPFLDEIFKGDSWKKVLNSNGTGKIPNIPKIQIKKEDNNDGTK